MARTLLAVTVAAPWLAWAVVRTAGVAVGPPLSAVIAFTPYAALTSVVPVVFALLLGRRLVALAAAAAAVSLIVAVAPRAFGESEAVRDEEPRLTIMSVNLHVARADPRGVLRLVRERNVDVLAVQESDPLWIARLDAAGARKVFTDWSIRPEDEALFSRRPMKETGARNLAEGDVALGGTTVRITVIHPRPPLSGDWVSSWRQELEAIPDAADVPPGTSRVLAGDFNATLDHRELRNVLDRGYRDAASAVGAGLKPTWPADRRLPPMIAIDHVLTSGGIRVLSFGVFDAGDSDHRGIVAELAAP